MEEPSISSEEVYKAAEHTGFREGHLFIIDLTPEMFNADNDSNEIYFEQCLQVYGRILSQKLSWNRRDWMGLLLFGTEKCDVNPETNHILTLQKFDEISPLELANLMHTLNNHIERYKKMSAESEYPLHDVLSHAIRCFQSVKVTMTQREVILLTRRDDPLTNDEAHRHRIRAEAQKFNDNNITLKIIGLGQDWNYELFYKDIEMLANKIDNDDIKRTLIDDLEMQIKFKAKTTAHLQLRIGDGLIIKTVISSFTSNTKFLKEVRVCPETNEVLDAVRNDGQSFNANNSDEEDESKLEEGTQAVNTARYTHECGGVTVSFTANELKKIRMPLEPGIDLIGFKKKSLDLRYHIDSTKFVGLDKAANDGQKELFTALLYQCEEKDVMAICAVHSRGGSSLAKLIPCTKYGGFYLYKIAFADQVRRLPDKLIMYKENDDDDDDDDDDCKPIDTAGIELMEKLIKKLQVRWDPNKMFSNPKLRAQLAYIQTLALDGVFEPVEDTTIPDIEDMDERLESIVAEFNKYFDISENAKKRPHAAAKKQDSSLKCPKFDDKNIQSLIDTGRLKEYTVPVLKAMAKSIGAGSTGIKASIIESIIKTFAEKNAN